MSTTSRRNFLKSATILSGGVTAFSTILSKNLFAGTASFGLPFYKPGSPFVNDLRMDTGASFTLQGIVYCCDGTTPLKNAVVEIWHCNQDGHFDFSKQYKYRGKTLTDQNGKYAFKTDFPGKYKGKFALEMSRVFVLASGPGHEESFSQLYFDHNKYPYIDDKHWAACPMADRPTLPKKTHSKDQNVITYNHYLRGFPLRNLDSKDVVNSHLRIYPNHQEQQTILTFGKFQPGLVSVRVLNKDGQLMQRHIFKNVKPFDQLTFNHQDFSAGIYTYNIFSSRFGDFVRGQRLG